MNVLRFTRLLALVALSLPAVGCARWTILPQANKPQAEASDEVEQTLLGLRRPGPILDRSNGSKVAQASHETSVAGGKSQSIPDDLKDLDPSLAIARLSERQGDGDQAARLYRAYLTRNPNHPLPHHRLGVMAARSAKFEEAEQHLQAAVKCGNPSAELLCDLGYLYYLQDRLDEAEEALLKACELEPGNQGACNNLALVYASQGEFEKSMRYFRRVNDEAEAHANVAFMLAQQGRLEHSRSAYLKALTVDKSLKTAAKALLQVENTRKAEELAQQRQQQLESQPQQAPAAAHSDPLLLSDAPGVAPQPLNAPPQRLAPLPSAAAPQAAVPAYASRSPESMLMPVPQPMSGQQAQGVPAWQGQPQQQVQPVSAQEPIGGAARQPTAENAYYQRPVSQRPAYETNPVTQAVHQSPAASSWPTYSDVRPATAEVPMPVPAPRSANPVRIGLSDAAAPQPQTAAPTPAPRGPVRVSLSGD